MTCPECDGTGKLPDGETCPECNGTGQVPDDNNEGDAA